MRGLGNDDGLPRAADDGYTDSIRALGKASSAADMKGQSDANAAAAAAIIRVAGGDGAGEGEKERNKED